MVYRPVNWSPLTGGDPAPGDPEGWSHVLHHWDFESTRMSERARKLGEITATGATSQRIERIESIAREGQALFTSFAASYTNAHTTT